MEIRNEFKTYPFYVRATVTLLGLTLLIYILNILQIILVPFAIAGLIAILLNPLNTFFEIKLPRLIAITLTIAIALLAAGTLIYFLLVELSVFSDTLPLLKRKFLILIGHLQQWLHQNLGLSLHKQMEMVKSPDKNENLVNLTIGTLLGMFSTLILVPIYVFLILYYKPLILDFLFHTFPEKHSLRVAEVLGETKNAIQSYIIGLLYETAIVAAMNSVALLLLGVPYAILIGVLGGVLNIIPYVGGLAAILLPLVMATITMHGYTTQIAIVGAYLVIQFIDNNILVPRIVASKVQINALFSIIIVLLGGMLWGIPGMFFSIPFVAVLKIIFDRVDGLKPLGLLLGDNVPVQHAGVPWQKRWNRIFQRLEKEKKKEAECGNTSQA